ncbi:MAG: hypothetical protein NT091_03820, partial [Candidatus Falkowbacteria bacterium]|nr:hypothetical protein [Candidatus Falkowbacteria bacterium]
MLAEKLGHKEVDVLHLSLCLINDKIIKIFLKRLSVNTDKLIFKINNELALVKKEPRDKNTTITLNESLKKALIETYLTVYKKNELQVYPINFLAGLEAYNDSLAEIFFDLELDENKILNCIEWFYIDKKIISQQ